MAYAMALQILLNSPRDMAHLLRVVRFTSPVLSVAVSAAFGLTSTPTLMAFNNNNKEDFYSAGTTSPSLELEPKDANAAVKS